MKIGPIQEKWLKYLEDHSEQQTRLKLGCKEDGNWKLCCLGAALIVLHGKSCTMRGEYLVDVYCAIEENKTVVKYSEGLLIGSYSEIGFFDEKGSLKIPLFYNGKDREHLSLLNDLGMPWKEIAAYIRKNPDNVFKESK